MYPKVKTVRRGDRSYEYLELVEGRREGGRVRQHVVENLGLVDELVAGGKLEQLAAGLARLHQPPPGTRRNGGPLLIVAHYLRALGVRRIVDEVIPRRGRALAGHGEITAVLAASRLCSPAPLYDIAGWASSAAVAELLGVPAALLNDDRLGRSLEALAPAAGDVRGRLLLAAVRGGAGAHAPPPAPDLAAVRVTRSYPGPALAGEGRGGGEGPRPAPGGTGGGGWRPPPPAPSGGAPRHELQAAYIWSSEEAAAVAAARDRALAKAEAALTRIRNGLGGRYYKTRKQVDARVAQILTGPVAGLLTVTTATRNGKPVLTCHPGQQAISPAPELHAP